MKTVKVCLFCLLLNPKSLEQCARVWSVVSNSLLPHELAPLSMRFSRQQYWSGLPFPSLEDLPDPGIEPGSPALQADALLSEPPGKPFKLCLVLHRVGHHPCITDKKTSLERLCKLPSRRKYLTLIKKDRAEGGDDQLHFSTSCIIPPVWVFHLFHTLYQACISTTGTV